jgi:hypothetical protein
MTQAKIPTTPTMQDLLDYGEVFSRHLMLEQGHETLMPMYHLIGPTDSMILGCPWSDETEKLGMVMLVKTKAREIGATMLLFLAEAWVAVEQAGQPANPLPPSQRPDRVEIVQVVVTDGDEIRMRVMEIKRNEGGKITDLVTKPEGNGPQMFSGRLIDGIIPPKQTH